MSSSSSQQPVTQTQNTTPWGPSQASLLNELTGANNLYNANIGYQPYTGPTLANLGPNGLDPNLWGGLNLEAELANDQAGGSAGLLAARNLGTNTLNSGGLSAGQLDTAGKYGDVYSKLGDVYSQASSQENPYLEATIAAQNRQIADKVNSSVSGAGRYGSGAQTDVLARSLAEAADPILAQDYTQRQQQRLAALQGQQTTAGGLEALYQSGQDTAGKWAQLMPTLDEAMYSPATHLQNVGNYYQNRGQQQLTNDISLYNAQQAYPWEELQRFQAAIAGAGAEGGTKVTATTPAVPSTLQRVSGGALTGAGLGSIFGPAGSGVGAGIGGLLGLL